MKNRLQSFLLIFLTLLLSGCAHVISDTMRDGVDPKLTFAEILRNPAAHTGKTVVLGGEVIETVNQKEGNTLLEVFQKPLDWRGEPSDTPPSEGRFLVLVDKYLDPYVYRKGRKVTVGGEILGERVRPLGEMDYRYPLIAGREIYLWPVYVYPPYPYYYYDPWWYAPWWGYPYYRWWGGWGWGYHYHPHHRHR